jgi:hypothetical protein
MLLVICMLIGFCFFLLERIWELRSRINKMEDALKSMNHDLNMIVHTQKNSKQILKG